ncbi:hypothetical protein CCUS01_02113 [Colletotrichum cuscutae]|uniref:Uncharacterized protein n=1 Tax=Colletotrichum cuscutae TaxID=1209917 RepID=A0AAI9XIX4_9PEZI|nr:hypothetical protein CCUS01_02113 [Colletotrichum cuscutae]
MGIKSLSPERQARIYFVTQNLFFFSKGLNESPSAFIYGSLTHQNSANTRRGHIQSHLMLDATCQFDVSKCRTRPPTLDVRCRLAWPQAASHRSPHNSIGIMIGFRSRTMYFSTCTIGSLRLAFRPPFYQYLELIGYLMLYGVTLPFIGISHRSYSMTISFLHILPGQSKTPVPPYVILSLVNDHFGTQTTESMELMCEAAATLGLNGGEKILHSSNSKDFRSLVVVHTFGSVSLDIGAMNNYDQEAPHEYELFEQVDQGGFHFEDGSNMNAENAPSQDRGHHLGIPMFGGSTDDSHNPMSFDIRLLKVDGRRTRVPEEWKLQDEEAMILAERTMEETKYECRRCRGVPSTAFGMETYKAIQFAEKKDLLQSTDHIRRSDYVSQKVVNRRRVGKASFGGELHTSGVTLLRGSLFPTSFFILAGPALLSHSSVDIPRNGLGNLSQMSFQDVARSVVPLIQWLLQPPSGIRRVLLPTQVGSKPHHPTACGKTQFDEHALDPGLCGKTHGMMRIISGTESGKRMNVNFHRQMSAESPRRQPQTEV